MKFKADVGVKISFEVSALQRPKYEKYIIIKNGSEMISKYTPSIYVD